MSVYIKTVHAQQIVCIDRPTGLNNVESTISEYEISESEIESESKRKKILHMKMYLSVSGIYFYCTYPKWKTLLID